MVIKKISNLALSTAKSLKRLVLNERKTCACELCKLVIKWLYFGHYLLSLLYGYKRPVSFTQLQYVIIRISKEIRFVRKSGN